MGIFIIYIGIKGPLFFYYNNFKGSLVIIIINFNGIKNMAHLVMLVIFCECDYLSNSQFTTHLSYFC
jgi:hypothetical protein